MTPSSFSLVSILAAFITVMIYCYLNDVVSSTTKEEFVEKFNEVKNIDFRFIRK